MIWKELVVTTERRCADPVAGIMINLGCNGVAIEGTSVPNDDYNLSPIISCPMEEQVKIKAYFGLDEGLAQDLKEKLAIVEETFGVKCLFSINEVNDEDWKETWKEHYHTFKIGHRLVIKPTWEEYHGWADDIIIEMDPGMAFGTGLHASTRFCLGILEEYIEDGERVFDAGCGSGILSIAAAKLGSGPVIAVDIDQLAGKVAVDNVRLNQVEDMIEVRVGDIFEEILKQEIDMALANITAEVLYEFIPRLSDNLTQGGVFIGSGIIESRWPWLKRRLELKGFRIEKVLTDADWVGLAARRL